MATCVVRWRKLNASKKFCTMSRLLLRKLNTYLTQQASQHVFKYQFIENSDDSGAFVARLHLDFPDASLHPLCVNGTSPE